MAADRAPANRRHGQADGAARPTGRDAMRSLLREIFSRGIG
ncbi:MAG: hypothetical protein RLZZ276_2006, partial [Pseudomonadota bacterium]